MVLRVKRDADAAVFDVDLGLRTGDDERDFDRRARGAVLDGVVEKVVQDPPDPVGVTAHVHTLARGAARDVRYVIALVPSDRIGDHVTQIEDDVFARRLVRQCARKIDKLVEQTVYPRDLRQGDAERFTLARGIFRHEPARHLYLAADGREGGAQLMDGGREELALSFRCGCHIHSSIPSVANLAPSWSPVLRLASGR